MRRLSRSVADVLVCCPRKTAEVDDHALLTAAQEKALAEAIANGDSSAKDRMIRANLRLVIKIAREFRGRGLDLEDLIGEGNLGLIRACEEYDPKFNTRFSTYAAYWIKQSIRHALINTTSTIRIPVHLVGAMTKWRREERSLTNNKDSSFSSEEIGKRLGMSRQQIELIQKAQRASRLKLENAVSTTESEGPLSRSVDKSQSPEDSIASQEELSELWRNLGRLTENEQFVLIHRFGLFGSTPLTFREIGNRLGFTREWVRKIGSRALQKLSGRSEQLADVGSPSFKASQLTRRGAARSEGCAYYQGAKHSHKECAAAY